MPDQPISEDKYLVDLEARKMDRTILETDIPGTKDLTDLAPDKIAEVLASVLGMGSIVELRLRVGENLHVKYYQNTSMGKGKLNDAVTKLSPDALVEAEEKRKQNAGK